MVCIFDFFSDAKPTGFSNPNVSFINVAVNNSITLTCQFCYKSVDLTITALIDWTQSPSCLTGPQFPPSINSSGCATSSIIIRATAPVLQFCTCTSHFSISTSGQSYFDQNAPSYSSTWSSSTGVNVTCKYFCV